jgi:mitogen-activated protein kinase kinase
VWSLGLTLLELAMNRFPLVNMNEDGSATPLQPFELLQTVVTFEMPSMNEEEGVVWTKSLQHFIKTWSVHLPAFAQLAFRIYSLTFFGSLSLSPSLPPSHPSPSASCSLDKNPNQRPGPKTLLDQHPWIAKSRTWNPDVKTWLVKVWDW